MSDLFKNINPLNSLLSQANLAEIIAACEQGLSLYLKQTNVLGDNLGSVISKALRVDCDIKNGKEEQEDKIAFEFLNSFCLENYSKNAFLLSINENNNNKVEQYIKNLS